MTIKEIKKDVKESFRGKLKDVLKPSLFYYLIPIMINTIYSIIVSVFALKTLDSFLNGSDVQSTLGNLVASILSIVIFFILTFIVNALLSYGMIACIMDIKRGNPVRFSTIFKKIGARIKKVFAVTGVSLLEGIIYTLIFGIVMVLLFGLVPFLSAKIPSILGSIMMIIATIAAVVFAVIYIYKIALLIFATQFSNFIINDYPDVKARAILNKSKKIISQNSCKYASLILCILWLIPAIIIITLISNTYFEYCLFVPEVTVFWGMVTDITSTAPTWFFVLKTIITTLIGIFISIKVFENSASFYTSFETDKLFDDDYVVPKEKFRYFFIALGLIILYIVLCFILNFAWTKCTSSIANKRLNEYLEEKQNSSYTSSWDSDDDSSTDTSVSNADVENIKVEFVGYTEDDNFVMKVRNQDEKPAVIRSIKTEFKNDAGITEKTVKSEETYFVVNPNSEIYVYNRGDYSEYKSYSFSVDLASLLWASDYFSDASNLKFITTDTEKGISLEIKNNSQNDLDLCKVTMLYYKDGKMIGIENGLSNEIYAGKAGFINFDSFTKPDYDNYIIQLDSCEKSSDSLSDKVSNLKLVETTLGEDGNLILKIKNNSNDAIYVDRVYTIFRDNSGKFIEQDSCDETYFVMKPQSEMYLHNIKWYGIDFSKYSNIEISPEISRLYIREKSYNIAIKTNENENNIEVQLTNNGEKDLDTIYLGCIFFKNKKPVAFEEGHRIWEDFPMGETVTIDIDYPTKGYTDKVDYDDYKVEIIGVD